MEWLLNCGNGLADKVRDILWKNASFLTAHGESTHVNPQFILRPMGIFLRTEVARGLLTAVWSSVLSNKYLALLKF